MTQETGLIVVGNTHSDNNEIRQCLDASDFYGEFDEVEGFWFFPEEEATYDALEISLQAMFDSWGIDARFEGVWN